jgi:hypothetical protein
MEENSTFGKELGQKRLFLKGLKVKKSNFWIKIKVFQFHELEKLPFLKDFGHKNPDL